MVNQTQFLDAGVQTINQWLRAQGCKLELTAETFAQNLQYQAGKPGEVVELTEFSVRIKDASTLQVTARGQRKGKVFVTKLWSIQTSGNKLKNLCSTRIYNQKWQKEIKTIHNLVDIVW
jgi:hypothetical protein